MSNYTKPLIQMVLIGEDLQTITKLQTNEHKVPHNAMRVKINQCIADRSEFEKMTDLVDSDCLVSLMNTIYYATSPTAQSTEM